MDKVICFRVVSNSNVWIQPDTSTGGQRVVSMDKTAFGTFQMVSSERVRDTTESKRWHVVEWCGVKRNDAIPTALYWYWLTGNESISRG